MPPFAHDQRTNLFLAALAVLFVVLLYKLAPVLTPFLFAAILAYTLNPGVDALCRRKVPRWLAVLGMIALVLLAGLVVIGVILPVLQNEVVQIQQKLPQFIKRLNDSVAPRLRTWFGMDVDFNIAALRRMISEQWATQDIVSTLLDSVKSGGLAIIAVLADVVLVPIVLFYLLLDWHALLRRLGTGVPRRWSPKVEQMAREIDGLLSQFMRGQMLVMLLLAVYYSLALALAGFDVALPVGMITGLLAFVPYLGFTVGVLLAILAALLQFTDWYGLIAVAIIYGLGQVLETYVLTPRLVGERIGLHPLAVIFALLAFGELFGFMGVLLALPASAALLVALRHIKTFYLHSELYRRST